MSKPVRRYYAWEKRGTSMYHLCVEDGIPVCGVQFKVSREGAPYFKLNKNTLGAGKKAVCWKCVDLAVNYLFAQGGSERSTPNVGLPKESGVNLDKGLGSSSDLNV